VNNRCRDCFFSADAPKNNEPLLPIVVQSEVIKMSFVFNYKTTRLKNNPRTEAMFCYIAFPMALSLQPITGI
jgi:hypothetical protein